MLRCVVHCLLVSVFEPSSTSVGQDKNVFTMYIYFAALGFSKTNGVRLICFRPPASLSRLCYKYYFVDTETIGFGRIFSHGGKGKKKL